MNTYLDIRISLGINHFSRILRVRAPSESTIRKRSYRSTNGGGKGLLAVSQLLTWKGSAVVFDLKGDLYHQTAGYRQTIGDVFRVDTRGFGDPYDPLQGEIEEDDLYTLPKTCYMSQMKGTGRHLRSVPRKC